MQIRPRLRRKTRCVRAPWLLSVHASHASQTIEMGTKIRLKIVGTRVDATEIVCPCSSLQILFSVLRSASVRHWDDQRGPSRRYRLSLSVLICCAIAIVHLCVTSHVLFLAGHLEYHVRACNALKFEGKCSSLFGSPPSLPPPARLRAEKVHKPTPYQNPVVALRGACVMFRSNHITTSGTPIGPSTEYKHF
jgi:hypothetical protein